MRRDFTIPVVDLSEETFRQVCVDREAGQYIGHPTTVRPGGGNTILMVYPRSHGRGPITMQRSEDGGRTWSGRLPVPRSWATSLEVPTLFETEDVAGKKRLVLFSGMYPIRMARSEDGGATWSELEPIGEFGGLVACSDLIRRDPGEYIAYFHDDGRFIAPLDEVQTEVYAMGEGASLCVRWAFSLPDGQGNRVPWNVCDSREGLRNIPGGRWRKIYTTRSGAEGVTDRVPVYTVYGIRTTDGGKTWSRPFACASRPPFKLCEAGIAPSPDGKRLAMLLRENSREANSHVCFSEDGGLTWSEPRELPGALTGDRHQVLPLPDGRLLVSFRDMAFGSPTRGDWCGWVGTFRDIEEGSEGQYRVRFMKNHDAWDCAYPALELLPDGEIFAATYGHWDPEDPHGPAYIMGLRFTMKELDEKATLC